MNNSKPFALITGASAGLGKEFARQLGAQGWNLLLCSRSSEKLASLALKLRVQSNIDVRTFAVDLSLEDGAHKLWQFVVCEQLEVELLVNNAGSAGGKLLNGEWAEHRAQLRLMTQSMAELCHYAIPPMQTRRCGRVINVASVVGRFAEARDSHYGPSKAFAIALSQGLAREVSGSGVSVMALCPGFTHTSFHDSLELQAMKSNTPAWLWYEAETVVREALQASGAGKSLFISGRLYRWIDPLIRVAWIQKLLLRGV
ncbi:MAG: SDR family NAD(P)-dependent oxidoreductase [Granulosicoccaceae bacterium]